MVLLVNGEPIKQLGGGVRKKPPPLFPQFANVGYWYDTTDQATVFADDAGTIAITDGTIARRINNKGFVAHDLTNAAGAAPVWRINQLNGLAGFTPNSQAIGGGAEGVAPVGSGANGCSFFAVGRLNFLSTTQATFGLTWLGTPQLLAQIIPPASADLIRIDFLGSGFTTLEPSGIDTDWRWIYATIDAAGNFDMQVSGQALVSGSATYNDIADAASFMRLGGLNTDALESMIWPNTVLTPTELQGVINYAEVKYGGVFPIP